MQGTSLDGKVFICRTPYGNTVQYYWRTICSDGEFILSVTFLVIIYLKDYQEESYYIFTSLSARMNYGKHKKWIQHKNTKVLRKGGGLVESKPSLPPEGNELNIQIDGNKRQVSKPNKYRGKRTWDKPSPDTKADTDFQVRCTDLEGYTFDLVPIASKIFSRTMKELER